MATSKSTSKDNEMKHDKTFAAIAKLQEIELELHRLKNALEMANKALDAKSEWIEFTSEEINEFEGWLDFKEEGSGWVPPGKIVAYISHKLKEKNT